MQLTISQLIAVTGCSAPRASTWLDPINKAMGKWGIDARQRAAYFLAQVSVESAALSRLEENLNYSAERLVQVWPSCFKTLSAASAYRPEPGEVGQRRVWRADGQHSRR